MEIARHWRLKQVRYGLVGDVCSEGHSNFPPDDVCKQCDPNTAIKNAIVKNSEAIQAQLKQATVKMYREQLDQKIITRERYDELLKAIS